jgi:hypothetical protein
MSAARVVRWCLRVDNVSIPLIACNRFASLFVSLIISLNILIIESYRLTLDVVH